MTAVIIEVQQAVRKIPIQSAQRVAGGREGGAEGQLPAAARQPRRRHPDHLRDLGHVPSDDSLPTTSPARRRTPWYYKAAACYEELGSKHVQRADGDHLHGLYFLFTFAFTTSTRHHVRW